MIIRCNGLDRLTVTNNDDSLLVIYLLNQNALFYFLKQKWKRFIIDGRYLSCKLDKIKSDFNMLKRIQFT